jgi:hypothetical protein
MTAVAQTPPTRSASTEDRRASGRDQYHPGRRARANRDDAGHQDVAGDVDRDGVTDLIPLQRDILMQRDRDVRPPRNRQGRRPFESDQLSPNQHCRQQIRATTHKNSPPHITCM